MFILVNIVILFLGMASLTTVYCFNALFCWKLRQKVKDMKRDASNSQQIKRAKDQRRLLIAAAGQAFMPFLLQCPGKLVICSKKAVLLLRLCVCRSYDVCSSIKLDTDRFLYSVSGGSFDWRYPYVDVRQTLLQGLAEFLGKNRRSEFCCARSNFKTTSNRLFGQRNKVLEEIFVFCSIVNICVLFDSKYLCFVR